MLVPRSLSALVLCTAVLACEGTPAVLHASFSRLDVRRCRPGPGSTGSPSTIEEAVQLANSLPFPVTAECFVEALDRPLRVEATTSRGSVQPAVGSRSPRLFVWPAETLAIAIVIDGAHRNLVELGQFMTPRRSVKGEIEFPLTEPLAVTAPLDRVRNEKHPGITTCFVCHDREEDEPSVPRGRSSLALRPAPDELVDLDQLRAEFLTCDPKAEPDRCRYLQALMAYGPVEHHPFDESLLLF